VLKKITLAQHCSFSVFKLWFSVISSITESQLRCPLEEPLCCWSLSVGWR